MVILNLISFLIFSLLREGVDKAASLNFSSEDKSVTKIESLDSDFFNEDKLRFYSFEIDQKTQFEPKVPVLLNIKSEDLNIVIESVGLGELKEMEIPSSVFSVGWYNPNNLGVIPGDNGAAVFASHVDSREEGKGPFYRLNYAKIGDIIQIEFDDSSSQIWQVESLETQPKNPDTYKKIFSWSGEPRIVLITCTGPYVKSKGGYQENLIVKAKQIS